MGTSYQQTAEAADCGYVDTPEVDVSRPVSCRCYGPSEDGSGAPGFPLRPGVSSQGQYMGAVQFELAPGLVYWPVGDWVVRWNVSIGTPDTVWQGVRIYRTRGCGLVELVAIHGSAQDLIPPISIADPEIYAMTVPASKVSQSFGSPDDRVLVHCVVASASAADREWEIVPNQLIDTPLEEREGRVGGWWPGQVSVAGSDRGVVVVGG